MIMDFPSNLQQSLHRLLLNSSSQRDLGLYHGKMGLILFFAHYFRLTKNPVFDDTANELMEELLSEIHNGLPVGLASGSAGVGWGMEYLIQNGFVDGDSLDICEEVDKKIMEKDPRRITDYSIETGLGGILHYVLAHIKGVVTQHSKMPFDETYLNDLEQALSNIPKNTELPEEFKELSAKYLDFYRNRNELDYSLSLSFIIDDLETENLRKSAPSASSAFQHNLGLNKGLSGLLLKELFAKNEDKKTEDKRQKTKD